MKNSFKICYFEVRNGGFMKITKVGLLLVVLTTGTMTAAMDNPNPGGSGYPYQYPYGQYPYNIPPVDYSQAPYGYGYYQYQGQPAATGYTDPYYGQYNPGVTMPYAYPAPPTYAAPAQAQPVAVPAAASVADQVQDTQDDDSTSASNVQQSGSTVTDVITDEEQEHLDKLADNLKKITDAILGVAASYAGAGVNLATLQLGDAAGEAILATAGNVKDAGQIAWWLSRASHHFDELSKPGVSKAAQVERDKLAPTLKAFKKKFSASPIKAIKNKLFGGKKDKKDSSQK